ncbi:helicase [Leptospira wolffii]|uniref:ATP-dependent DNA helicase n=1 Tax=Leptospira wolffii TaxID=409998 RepID=UPI001083DBEE|nr:helicase C-terminal domain-containing protein [Leptospira wolffii]TGK56953.1 helicase [Leptospira wolffii]TGK70986.1 helicase [Leptospira wolffii]TGK75677.1 helicase [Leptospira wolffii]TGL32725.1 helicase [Leptospira wolffii]
MGRAEEQFAKLSGIWPDFESRPGQIQMANSVETSFREAKHLIVEAGTGVGKSLAYLIPAALSAIANEETVVISTETKALQDQLIRKDIPLVSEILGEEIRAEIAMGASNYVCKRKLSHVLSQGTFGPEMMDHLNSFKDWVSVSSSGRRQEYDGFASPDFWSKVTREADSCLGRSCPNFSNSFYFLERAKWQKAHILIVNHHLLAAHIASDFNILPEFKKLVIDEAHNFPETLGSAFRIELSSLEIQKLLQNVWNSQKKSGLGARLNSPKINELASQAGDKLFICFNRLLGELPLNFYGSQRIRRPLKMDGGDLESVLDSLQESLFLELKKYSKDSEELEEKEIALEIEMLAGRIGQVAEGLHLFRTMDSGERVYWADPPNTKTKEMFPKLLTQPLESETILREVLEPRTESIVFTSATLATNKGDLKYFGDRIGQLPSRSKLVPSPFPYEKNALLFLPKDIKDATESAERNAADLSRYILKLIELTNGGTFVLFTSNKSLNEIIETIRPLTDLPIFSQLELGPELAKTRFLAEKNAVLFGVSSFWQGIDIRGDKLRSVILTKLPFQPPNDPVLEARSEKLKEKGGNPFKDLQLPYATTILKQGFGRLIRSEKDTGIVSLLDSRIWTKSYGRDLIDALPPAKRISEWNQLKLEYSKLPKYDAGVAV